MARLYLNITEAAGSGSLQTGTAAPAVCLSLPPAGLCHYLQLDCVTPLLMMQAVLSLVQTDAMGAQLLMRPFAVTGLVSLSSPQHLAATAAWPHSSEEGSHNAQSMLSLVASILHNPFLPGAPDSLVKELQEVMPPLMCKVARTSVC